MTGPTCQARKTYWSRQFRRQLTRPCGRVAVVRVEYQIGRRVDQLDLCDLHEITGDPARAMLADRVTVQTLGAGPLPTGRPGQTDPRP